MLPTPPPAKPGASPRPTHEAHTPGDGCDRTTPNRGTNARLAVGAAALLVILSLVFGSGATAIAVAVVCAATLQGLWRGAAEVFGVVVAMLVAAVLAPPLGRLLEGATHAAIGTTGLTNRLASVGLVAGVVTIVLAGFLGSAARRWLERRPAWRVKDRYMGAGLGLVEGVLIVAVLFWALLLLEPIARSRLGAMAGENPVAEGVVAVANAARQSVLFGAAESTSPLAGFDLAALIADFAAITAHPRAREHLLASEVIQKITNLPSLRAAMDEVKGDASLAGLVDEEGLTADDVRTFMNSDTVLRIIDRGDAVRDLKPLAEDLKRAIREAKALAAERPPA